MEFKIRKDFKTAPFQVPAEIVDSHLKLAGALQLRVILYCLRHTYDAEIDPKYMSELFSTPEEDIIDALMFWAELGYIERKGVSATALTTVEPPKRVAPPKVPRPDRKEVVRRGNESSDIAFLLNEAQMKFGRNLKHSESSVLVWIYDDLGMSASIILMVLEYARQAERLNISYIEKVAKNWVDNGIDTIALAEKRILELGNERTAWRKLRIAFGLDSRAPSETEVKMAKEAVLEWKMPDELLKKAYSLCIDSVGKYKAAYIKKVLTEWHKAGVKNLDDLEKLTAQKNDDKPQKSKKTGSESMATYDLSLLDKIINGD